MNVDAQAVIETADLGRRYGQTWAVRGVTASIRRGEIFGIVGPDGAGKTTLLQLFAAILDPSVGTCRVLGHDSVRQASQITAQIGYMPQGFTLYHRLTVSENIAFAARIRDVSPQELAYRRMRLLAMAGLDRFEHRPEHQLSGGMRKKLALCTNLIHEPPLLILDEPSLGVDPLSRAELWRMLEDFRRNGATIVLTTSYMDEAERCDRVAILDSGNIKATGSPAELKALGEGAVFELTAENLHDAAGRLQTSPFVTSIQRRSDQIRFTVQRDLISFEELRASLAGVGEIKTVTPSLGDLFALLSESKIETDQEASSPRVYLQKPVATPGGDEGLTTVALTRRFGTFTAVEGVSLNIRVGEILGLVGPNGAGKTTLIRMLCGLLAPSSGQARVVGFDVQRESKKLRQRIGYMSQSFSLYPELTVGENLAFFASAYGLRGKAARSAIDWARATVNLENIPDWQVSSLSGAIRQRLALACSILHRPQVLFLDEPTSGVDPVARFRFWELISALAEAGTIVLVSTHYLEEVYFCNRVGLMLDGRLIALGDLASLRSDLGLGEQSTIEDVFIAYIERERGSSRTASIAT